MAKKKKEILFRNDCNRETSGYNWHRFQIQHEQRGISGPAGVRVVVQVKGKLLRGKIRAKREF